MNNVRHRKNDMPTAFFAHLIYMSPQAKSEVFYRKSKTMQCMARTMLRRAEKLRAMKFKFRRIS